MANAPFVVDAGGGIRNAQNDKIDVERFHHRMTMLDVVETGFINSKRGDAPQAHKDIYKKAVNLMTSRQMAAFRIQEEKPEVLTAYGNNNFGRGLVMARRLVEIGVPFVEVTLDGWDLHQRVFDGLKTRLLPSLDQGLSALVNDLSSRGMLEHTVIVCMGEFGRTPRINQDVGRDHWAQSWSVVMTGGGLQSGRVIGGTDKEGVAVDGKSYLPGDVWATVGARLGHPAQHGLHVETGPPHESRQRRHTDPGTDQLSEYGVLVFPVKNRGIQVRVHGGLSAMSSHAQRRLNTGGGSRQAPPTSLTFLGCRHEAMRRSIGSALQLPIGTGR